MLIWFEMEKYLSILANRHLIWLIFNFKNENNKKPSQNHHNPEHTAPNTPNTLNLDKYYVLRKIIGLKIIILN